MPKKTSIHPDFKVVTVTDTKGGEFKICATLKKPNYQQEIDTHSHIAWNKQKEFNALSKSSAAQSFQDKYGDLV